MRAQRCNSQTVLQSIEKTRQPSAVLLEIRDFSAIFERLSRLHQREMALDAHSQSVRTDQARKMVVVLFGGIPEFQHQENVGRRTRRRTTRRLVARCTWQS